MNGAKYHHVQNTDNTEGGLLCVMYVCKWKSATLPHDDVYIHETGNMSPLCIRTMQDDACM